MSYFYYKIAKIA